MRFGAEFMEVVQPSRCLLGCGVLGEEEEAGTQGCREAGTKTPFGRMAVPGGRRTDRNVCVTYGAGCEVRGHRGLIELEEAIVKGI